MTKKIRKTGFLFAAGAIAAFMLIRLVPTASAARMPNRVQKTFTLTGQDALELAKVLGIPGETSADYHFPWEQSDAQCYQPGGGTALCDPTPAPVNTVHFEASANPQLVFSGTWLDTRTGNGSDMPAFQFSRRFSDESPLADAWGTLWRSISEKIKSAKNHRVELFPDSPTYVSIELGERPPYRWLTIGLDDRSPTERRMSAERYESCLEYHRQHPDLDSGC